MKSETHATLRPVEELARELWERDRWGALIRSDDPSPWAENAIKIRRQFWDEVPEEGSDGPCNVDCQCEHHFLGKKEWRALVEFIREREALHV